MNHTQLDHHYTRPLTSWERMLNLSPYSIVSMVARINGKVTEEMVNNAVKKVQQRHTLLRTKILIDKKNTPWFSSKDVEDIPIEVIDRSNDETWIKVYDDACRFPFDFDKRPAIRFYLLKSEDVSDLLIFCHHIICDGISLAYLARDLMECLGNPTSDLSILPDPIPLTKENIPEDQQLSGFIQKIMTKINLKWEAEKIGFDQEDYLNVHKVYWENYHHKSISIELDEAQTALLIKKCKQENVSVNSALSAAFIGAQSNYKELKSGLSITGVGVNLRNKLTPPEGEGMGFYAGAVNIKFKYNSKKNFWENARTFHKTAKKMYTTKNFFKDPKTFAVLEPSLMEARHMKLLGGLVPADFSRYEKLSDFHKREDTLQKLLKRSKADTLDKIVMGTAVTNLTRLNFPQKYGDLELDRLIMQPGGAFPLATVNLVIGVVTCSNKMSILLEFAEEQLATKIALDIKKMALKNLLA
ncbi:hypothetical protein NEF87_000645 [Candidatus Lokiarchaeum ossiferum]|uniref:Condensation domain-containing protein n=1 Tax=Candidatus Lokiarchaeum ossiferum TaxID=2951803 RepID=A0ABY6HLV5_9ARCH|nr:hypothetical protein NEF87_000645 [Candidatus Lokiarchaeum sp. B-35]